jgi:hypothetical protein
MHTVLRLARVIGTVSVLAVALAPESPRPASPREWRLGGPAAASAVVPVTKLRFVQWPKQVGIRPAAPHATWSGKIAQRCNASVAAFSVANTTTASQTMTLDGAAFVKVAPGADNAVCLWGSGTETFTIGTVGARYVTTLTVS